MFKYTPVDPVRFPKVQKKLEEQIKTNFEATLKVIQVKVAKILKNDTNKGR